MSHFWTNRESPTPGQGRINPWNTGKMSQMMPVAKRQPGSVFLDRVIGSIPYAFGNPEESVVGAHQSFHRRPEKFAMAEFSGCARTGISKADQKAELGRQMAINYVQVAIRDLKQAPGASSFSKAYSDALRVHFLNPDDKQRDAIREKYQRILTALHDSKTIACASSKDDEEECQKPSQPVGFVRPGETTVNLCPVFFDESITCRALLLIHEAGHTIGIGTKPPHPPYRGGTDYPRPGVTAPATQTTAMRMDNPDAYGYFAANIWRETDTHCLPPFQFNMIIEINANAPVKNSK